jgi:hypothetical protein
MKIHKIHENFRKYLKEGLGVDHDRICMFHYDAGKKKVIRKLKSVGSSLPKDFEMVVGRVASNRFNQIYHRGN